MKLHDITPARPADLLFVTLGQKCDDHCTATTYLGGHHDCGRRLLGGGHDSTWACECRTCCYDGRWLHNPTHYFLGDVGPDDQYICDHCRAGDCPQ